MLNILVYNVGEKLLDLRLVQDDKEAINSRILDLVLRERKYLLCICILTLHILC